MRDNMVKSFVFLDSRGRGHNSCGHGKVTFRRAYATEGTDLYKVDEMVDVIELEISGFSEHPESGGPGRYWPPRFEWIATVNAMSIDNPSPSALGKWHGGGDGEEILHFRVGEITDWKVRGTITARSDGYRQAFRIEGGEACYHFLREMVLLAPQITAVL